MGLRKIGKILLFAAAGFLIVILTLMLGITVALDRAPRYQAEIKDWVHRQTGFHIAFSHVSPSFRWYGPELYFDQLELRSKDDARVLARAAGGRVGADIWQLLRSGKLFAVRVELDSPDIVIARVGPGTFSLASEIVLGGEGDAFPTLRLNDLPAGTLAIRHGFVTVQNWNAALPLLQLRAVNVDLYRGAELASATLTAQLPAVLGGAVSFHGTVHGAGRLASLDWSFLASARGMSFAGWRELLPEYLTKLNAGTGAFELLAHGQGPTLLKADLDFGAQGVVANFAEGSSAKFAELSGLLSILHADDRWTLHGRRMRARSGGRSDPDSELDVTWRGNDSGVLDLSARASYLRAETLLPLAGFMPQKDLRDRLRDIAPTGEWMDLRIELARAAVNAAWRLNTHAQFRDVGFAPVGHAPGLRGLSGMFAGDENGGHVIIDTKQAIFNWPSQFPQPVSLSTLRTTLYWKRSVEEFLVATPGLEIEARGAHVQAKVAWHQPSDGSSPLLSVAGTINGGSVADAHLFLPRENLSAPALAWLNRAFVAGRLTRASIVFQGPVRRFPFRDGGGVFLARCNIDGMTLDYREGWPRIEGISVQAEFRNEGMSVRASSARTGGLLVDSGDARFADFSNGELEMHAALHSDAVDGLQFMRATPIDADSDHLFSSVEGRGPLTATVNLFLPFKQFDHRRVLVHVHLDGATVNEKGSTLMASDLTGDADIDGGQVARADVHGRVLGGAFQMTAHAPRNRPVTRTQLDFHGVMTAEALRTALSLPASFPIAGQTDWHGALKVAPDPARERSLRLVSNLAGLELKLPEPLAKPAGGVLPVWVETQWPPSGGSQVRLALGSVLRCALTFDSDVNGPKLNRLALTFGSAEPVFSDVQVVNVGGNIGELDLAGWLKLSASAKSTKPLANYLQSAKFAVARLDYLGVSFLDVTLELTENGGGWRIAASGPNVVGTISVPGAANPAEPWNMQFERLNAVDAAPQDTSAAAAPVAPADSSGGIDPRSIPAIILHASELTWGDRHLGDVRGTLAKLDDGVSLKQLTITGPVFIANAKGEWRGKDGGMSHIEGAITSTDVAETLKQLGFADVIEAKTGTLEFNMGWIGPPTADSLRLATGHVRVALEKGQVVGLKPGAGRVVGLASVAALPRRLALDFSDLTDKGFAFDTVRGDFDLRDGSAYTDNLLVKGPAAEIGLIGRVGLKNKDYDQTAVVTGNVGSSPLPLAAFAAGPVIGGAVLLFTQVFKQPLKGLVRGYYRITGSWENPTVERIKSADAAAAAAEAPK